MSLYGIMRTGVSGMNAQSNKLSTVSDNIANVNTTGYKRASTEFSSLILKSGSGNYDSGAVETHVRYAITDPGHMQFTTSTTDLAVQGNIVAPWVGIREGAQFNGAVEMGKAAASHAVTPQAGDGLNDRVVDRMLQG